MTRRNPRLLGMTAILIVLAALLIAGVLGIAVSPARAENSEGMLRIQVAVRPERLIAPDDVMLSFIIENISDEDAQNVYLSSADGLLFELVGQIAPGESQSFSRQHSVTAEELDAGEILYTVSHDDPDDTNVKINYAVRAQIRRSDALPEVEFTRQFSSRSTAVGGMVTITYRVRNTGNVPLTDLQVQDALGNFVGRVDELNTGESRTLINRSAVDALSVSSASLSYRVEGSDDVIVKTLEDAEVNLADANLDALFTAGYSAFSKSTADVVLTLTNGGNVGYRSLCIIDDIYGGVIADNLVLPVGSDPLEVSHAYAVRGDDGYRWRVTGKSDAGDKIDFLTETLSLSPLATGSPDALRLSAQALTPRIRRSGDVTLRVTIENAGGVDVRDIRLSESSLGELCTFAVLPADGTIQRDFTLHVADDVSYSFRIDCAVASGFALYTEAVPVDVIITPDGVMPEGAQPRLFEFSGGSIKIGGSSTFAVLLLAGCAVLLTLVVILIIATHRQRMERKLKIAAERQRRREELGKTNRFTPVRVPQKTKSKGRN